MHDLELEAYAKARLTTYRRETTCARHLPRRSWRSRVALMLRNLADGLEPKPVSVHPPRLRA